MQISLQQIIAAQKLQARQSFRTSFPAPQKDNVHSPSLITKEQGTNRPNSKEGCSPILISPAPRTPQSSGSHRIADEDQRSDNTTSAGYMMETTHGSAQLDQHMIAGTSSILGLPHPENIRYVPFFSFLFFSLFSHDFSVFRLSPSSSHLSDETIAALFEFAQREMGKRNIQNINTTTTTSATGTHSMSSSQNHGNVTHGTGPSVGVANPHSPTKPPSGKHRGAGPASPMTSGNSPLMGSTKRNNTQQRRPRSKSGGCEAAVLELDSASSMPLIMASDDDEVSESGRLPPTEKMLGLAPGYLAKPSPGGSPWLVFEGAPQQSNSPTRPISSSSPLPIQVQRYGPSSREGSTNGNTSFGNSRGSELHNSKEGLAVTGPLRLPAKKLTATPLSVFTDYFKNYVKQQQQQQQQKSGQKNHRYRDDNLHSGGHAGGSTHFTSLTPSDEANGSVASSQQLRQQLVISPRTAFDDLSVSSAASSGSAASSSNSRSSRGRSYRAAATTSTATTSSRRAMVGIYSSMAAVTIASPVGIVGTAVVAKDKDNSNTAASGATSFSTIPSACNSNSGKSVGGQK